MLFAAHKIFTFHTNDRFNSPLHPPPKSFLLLLWLFFSHPVPSVSKVPHSSLPSLPRPRFHHSIKPSLVGAENKRIQRNLFPGSQCQMRSICNRVGLAATSPQPETPLLGWQFIYTNWGAPSQAGLVATTHYGTGHTCSRTMRGSRWVWTAGQGAQGRNEMVPFSMLSGNPRTPDALPLPSFCRGRWRGEQHGKVCGRAKRLCSVLRGALSLRKAR